MFGRRADAKMVRYLVGAVLLQLNLLSFAAHHFLAYPDDPSPGVVLYVALLFPRERDDDRRCAEKYGAPWDQYRQKVPWRIVPKVY